MQIIINGRHFEVTNLIRNNATEKLKSLFMHYPTLKVSSVRVTMEIAKNHQARVQVTAALKKHMLRAAGFELDLYSAVDTAFERLKTQLERYVDKYKRPEKAPPLRELIGEPMASQA